MESLYSRMGNRGRRSVLGGKGAYQTVVVIHRPTHVGFREARRGDFRGGEQGGSSRFPRHVFAGQVVNTQRHLADEVAFSPRRDLFFVPVRTDDDNVARPVPDQKNLVADFALHHQCLAGLKNLDRELHGVRVGG